VTSRFTIDGSAALEEHLAATCDRVRAGVQSLVPAKKLEGILLGGGYGRGEGGVLRTPTGDRPYNDLEFYVFIGGQALLVERKFREPLHRLAERLSPEAGLEVELKVLTRHKLRRSGPSMFYYDLITGHRQVLGDDSLLAGCEHHAHAAAIPLHEATRLLFNRCSGLLFCLERLRRPEFGSEEADFVGRNLAKAQLAFGDVLLAAHGQYHWSCRERQRRLAQSAVGEGMPWAETIKAQHAAGVEFKLHPARSSETRETLAARHVELAELGRQLWLWLESKRLRVATSSARAYALSAVDKCPETSSLRNRLVNARMWGVAGLAWARYPRQRLFHALALLLWEPATRSNPDLSRRLRHELRTEAGDFAALVSAYQQLWSRCN
jgi:hypothetical protein